MQGILLGSSTVVLAGNRTTEMQEPGVVCIDAPFDFPSFGQAVAEPEPVTSASQQRSNGELLTGVEAAKLVGVSRATWYNWIAAGYAPQCIRVGARGRWRKTELLGWIKAGGPPANRWSWHDIGSGYGG